MGDILFFFLRNDVSTYGKKIITVTPFLSFAAPKTSLVVLVFPVSLGLVSGLLSTRYISIRKVSGLVLSKVFILLLG